MKNKKTKTVLIDLQYLPGIEYIRALLNYNEIVFEMQEHFSKQTYRNRCHILTANKVLPLVVPVKHPLKQRMLQIEIDYSEKWHWIHWRSIESAYAKAPFFEFYAEPFKDIILGKPKYLWNLNLDLLKAIFLSLDLGFSFRFSDHYDKMSGDANIDFRSFFHPKKAISSEVRYKQVFGKEFVSNLSIIDLIFCTGPEAVRLLKNPTNGE